MPDWKPQSFAGLAATTLALVLFSSGCGGSRERVVDAVNILQGSDQCAPPRSTCSRKIGVELLGPKRMGIFGGRKRSPVPGVTLLFKAAPGSDVSATPERTTTDSGGMAFATVETGSLIGDQYLLVEPEGFPEKAERVRIVSGLSIEGADQEAHCGAFVPKPIKARVFDSAGNPAVGAVIHFRVVSSPGKKGKAKCDPLEVLTDDRGIAETRCRVGDETGEYTILVEASDPAINLHARGVEVAVMGLNLTGLTGLIVTVLAGLAIFIFGMKQMSDGLMLIAGNKMRNILQFFARNRFVAVAAGALVTGVIQSSSACSVMVVGFVNAGLLSLGQAIGILLGANIGTTITAQMISFKLGALAMPAIIIGMLMAMTAKRAVTKGWGQTVLGFGLLFYGMGIMSGELKVIGSFPTFINFFSKFNCAPVDGVMPMGAVCGAVVIGMVMTLVIQSSSATIGIALALAVGGLLNFYTAIPLILGDNIGTTITGVLASIGTNKHAKQAAISNVFIKSIGTAYMLVLFYVPWPGTTVPVFLQFINLITPGDVFAPSHENIARHIAMAHTMFNVINVAVFLPLIGVLVKLCNLIFPIKESEKVKVVHLEPHLLDTPSVALEQVIDSIRYMAKESWQMIEAAMTRSFLPVKVDKELVTELIEREEKIDELQEKVTSYLVKLTSRQLTEPQSEIVPLLMHCTNDAERIADFTENILALTERLKHAKKDLSDAAEVELRELWKVLSNQAESVIACLENTDKRHVMVALKDERKINKLADKYEKAHIKRLRKGKCHPTVGVIFIEILSELERIGDHFTNIADRAPDIQKHHLQLRD